MIGDRPWVVTLPLANAAEGRGLSKLWARRKIADAEVARTLRQVTPEEADQRILALALEHHLVTRLTSLVAVEQTPSRPDGARSPAPTCPSTCRPAGNLTRCSAASARPYRRRRSAGPTASRPARADVYAAVTVAAAPQPAAPEVAAVATPQNGVILPKTATDAELRLWFGLAALRRRA